MRSSSIEVSSIEVVFHIKVIQSYIQIPSKVGRYDSQGQKHSKVKMADISGQKTRKSDTWTEGQNTDKVSRSDTPGHKCGKQGI